MAGSGKLGVLVLARPTFDLAFAAALVDTAFAALEATGWEVAGGPILLLDPAAAERALDRLSGQVLDRVLILQATFTDAAMTVRIAEALSAPLSLWAFPEPRTGGRLRLNSLCGLNLAVHALGLRGVPFSWLHAAPDAAGIGAALGELLSGGRMATPLTPEPADPFRSEAGDALVAGLRGKRIARIGVRPEGFDTCDYDARALDELAGVSVSALELDDLFDKARAAGKTDVSDARATAEADLAGLDAVDQDALARSLALKAALDEIRAEGGFDAFAIRCWPETFTEYGGAVCGPVSMMAERRVPCACEADVGGALTSLIVQRIAGEPAFLVDLVDIDPEDGTAVVWHCGQAPVSMADPDFRPRATIHSNRRMPLLYEFPLKPGRVTFARVSRARGEEKLVIAGGEMLKRPLPFSGTSGTVRFDAPAERVLDSVIGAALEHHMALAYGDHRGALRAAAAGLGLPVLEI